MSASCITRAECLVLSERFELSSSRLSTVRVCQLRHDSLKSWCRRGDSNPHCLVPKTSASCQLGYFGLSYGGRIRTYVCEFQRLVPFQLGYSVKDCGEPGTIRTCDLDLRRVAL